MRYKYIKTILVNKLHFLLLALLFISSSVYSNNGDYKFKHFNVDDGLSQTTILSICQDYQGFMWFGTRFGLNKYDGYSFTQYYSIEHDSLSLNSNYINKIFEDTKQNLWIGTSEGLNRFDRSSNSFERVTINQDQTIQSINIIDILENLKGEIFVASKKDIFKLDTEKQILNKTIRDKIPGDINFIYFDSYSSMYTGTNQGLFKDTISKSLINGFGANCYCPETNDKLWIGSVNKLFLFDINDNSIESFDIRQILITEPYVAIRKIEKGNDNNLWILTYHGIVLFNTKSRSFTKLINHNPNDINSISDNSQTAIYKDYNKSFWIGTFSGGLNYLEEDFVSFKHFNQIPYTPNTLNSNIISAFEESKNGNLVIGTGRGGINVFDTISGTYKYYYTDLNVRELLYSYNGDLFVGTFQDGLLWLDSEFKLKKAFNKQSTGNELSENFIYELFEDSKKRIWVATSESLYRFNRNTSHFIKYNLNDLRKLNILNIKETSTGRLLLTNWEGIYEYNELSDSFSLILTQGSNRLNKGVIQCFDEDTQNNWWIGSANGVVQYDSKLDSCYYFNKKNGLTTDNIIGIVCDDYGKCWISTTNGLNSINTKTHEIKSYDLSNGLQGLAYRRNATFKLLNGKILMGGGNGFNMFNPNNVAYNTIPPKLAFTELQVSFNKVDINAKDSPIKEHISVAKEVIFQPYQKTFSIHYAALSYKSNFKNKYAYYLDGFDTEWNYVNNNRFATYTNLKPGEYTFKIKACNNDEVWNNEGISIRIIVLPYFYQTRYFKIFTAVILLLLVVLIVQLKVRNSKKISKKLSLMVNERTKQLEHANSILLEQKEEIEAQRDEIEIHLNELEYHHNNLENLVEERTHQLNKEKQRAEKSDNLKTAFLANMSHEIRTPLNAILGFSEILCNDQYDSDNKTEIKKIIEENSENLLKLIDDILDLSKIESNQIDFKFQDIDVHKILESQLNIFVQANIISENKPIEFNLSIPENSDQLIINTDLTRLSQVFSNLISNALKFTDRGNIEIGYEIKKDFVQFFVSDTGIGIAPEELHVVFERFRKLEYKNKLYRGSGLGLSITQKIIEMLGGNICADSILGKGTTFFFTLPIKQDR